MQLQSTSYSTKAHTRHRRNISTHTRPQALASAPGFTGLTRAQLREIVLEQLG